MALFEIVVVLLLAGAVLAAWARRLHAPYPAFLAVAGAVLALLPGTPALSLEPELVMTLFVAPTLLDAAYDMSLRDLRNYWVPIAGSAVVAVVVTVAAVAGLARMLQPEMPWPAAIALGAIVAPPDASAATTVLRALHPPHRVMVILEGESLLNDATALLIYRAAVLAALGAWAGWSSTPMLVLAVVGSVLLGLILGRLWPIIGRYITDIPTSVVTQFVTTFAVWILAERLKLSPVITLVCYAMTLARRPGGILDGPRRIQSYAVWDVAVFVLNVLAFILAGLQLRPILAGVHSAATPGAFGFAGAVLGTAVLIRIAWVMGYNTVARWKNRRAGVRPPWPVTPPTVATGLINAWCGMRGVVTLATALALPEGFPFRDLILLSAFGVVLGTLVIQGLTLRPLMLALKLSDTGEVEKEVRFARRRVAQAALDSLGDAADPARPLREEQSALLRHSQHGASPEDAMLLQARRRVLKVQRQALFRLRAAGEIGDDAFHVVEEELDAFEFYSERRLARLIA